MKLLTLLLPLQMLLSCASASRPLPVPENALVESSEPRQAIFERLSDQNKNLLYHLNRSARIGHELLVEQRHRYGHSIKKFFQTAFVPENLAKIRENLGNEAAYKEFMIYGLMFLDTAGPYDARSNTKYILTKVDQNKMSGFLQEFGPEASVTDQENILKLFFDPAFETHQRADADNLEKVGGNLYPAGLTKTKLDNAIANRKINIDLNTQVIFDAEGDLKSQVLTVDTPGITGLTLTAVVKELEKALEYCGTEDQCKQLSCLIEYYQKGDVEEFRQSNIAWVEDNTSSAVDFTNGWVEIYEDHRGTIGSWQSVITIVDKQLAAQAELLANNAQYFENKMPYGPYKKTFPPNYAPPAIVAPYFLELTSFHSGGFNLPNFDDIRESVGFKNVIRAPFEGADQDPEKVATNRQSFFEFMPKSKVEKALQYRQQLWMNLVMMHEIIGHGSGTYNSEKYPDKADPVSSLGKEIGSSIASAMEEQRSDLTALTFVNDPKLVEIGIYENQDHADLMRNITYDWYLADLLIRFSRDRSWTEAHARGHLLFVNYQLRHGGAAWVNKDGSSTFDNFNRVLAVTDYEVFQKNAKDVLEKLQGMKAEKKGQELVDFFDDYASLKTEQEDWAQVMIERSTNMRYKWPTFSQAWDIVEEGSNKKLVFYGDLSLESCAHHFSRMVN